MILKALNDLYYNLQKKGLLPEDGFAPVDVKFILSLSSDGDIVDFIPTSSFLDTQQFILPVQSGRTGKHGWPEGSENGPAGGCSGVRVPSAPASNTQRSAGPAPDSGNPGEPPAGQFPLQVPGGDSSREAGPCPRPQIRSAP